jgi:DNA segregation ATPase FtsK/SpoIIIE, S-DNA-T family
MVSPEKKRELLGLALLALGSFLALSLVPVSALGLGGVFPTGNVMGRLGGWFGAAAYALLGAGAPVLPLTLGLGGAALSGWVPVALAARWAVLLAGLAVLAPAWLWLFTVGAGGGRFVPESVGGWLGSGVGFLLGGLLGRFGAALALLALMALLSVATVGWNPASATLRAAGAAIGRALGRPRSATPGPAPEPDAGPWAGRGEAEATEAAPEPPPPVQADAAPPRRGRLLRRRSPATAADLTDSGDPASTDRPPLVLLQTPPPSDPTLGEKELDRLGRVLIETLRTFKVEGEIVGRTTGPVVTQFEVAPAPGVKVNRIASLDADLALALRAPSVRIVAPIPGKGAVGVEVPNPEPQTVRLREILESVAFQKARGQLPLALGKDLTGRPYVADLARMPHLLIAGATGSGKSVCINTIITSLIYRYAPQQLRLLLIDPKMVELSMYGDLPHLRHPVVTDPSDAATVLKWAVMEMERRYLLLSENGARSLAEFNRRAQEGQPLRRIAPAGYGEEQDGPAYTEGPLQYVVVVVDELADLMMTVQADIERPLAQLAQKARAIGIHLIVATQRPSVNVITGLIKANFPCRIGFRVSSKVDSRTILDQNGADALLGNGDMLFLPPGTSDPVRIQGAYLTTEETEELMSWYRDRAHRPSGEEENILEVVRAREGEAGDAEVAHTGERDALFQQAAEICIQHRQGSTSLLQRKLRIGYGRAARIIDQLYEAGVLGPPQDGSRPREVLVGLESIARL